MPRTSNARASRPNTTTRAGAEVAASTRAGERETPSIVRRGDGYWWKSSDGLRLIGPFRSRAEAMFDRDERQDMALELPDTDDDYDEDLRLAEDELGVPDWVDPETGELADEGWTRTDQH